MVLRGVDDFLAGQRIPLAVLESLGLATDVTDAPRLRVS